MSDRDLVLDQDTYAQCFLDSTDTVIITDAAGRILDANPAWLQLYGYTEAEVIGASTRIIQGPHTSREMYEHMWSQIRDPAVGHWRGSIVNRTRAGEEVPILLTITPIRKDGTIVGYLGIGLDDRERVRAEEFRNLYDLVVRHDLKAPLGAVIMSLETLLEGLVGALTAPQRDALTRALRAASRMQGIIATSLDVEKLRRQQLRLDLADVDVAEAVRTAFDTLREVADRRGVRLQGPPPEQRVVRRLDGVHVQRCVDNLVKNAVEAAPRDSAVTVAVAEEGPGVKLRVHNVGPPIPPDVRATLFHPFSTFGKRGGTGLGLYGVKLTVEAMGGTVSHETGEAGTAFTIRFPDGVAAATAS